MLAIARLAFIVALVTALAGLFGSDPARACSCSPRNIPGGEQMMSMAPVIFSGVAVAVRTIARNEIETTFEVTEAFKGATVGRRLQIRHRKALPGSCGVSFAIGETRTLAAQKSGGMLSANLCTVWMFKVPGGEKLIEEMRRLSRSGR